MTPRVVRNVEELRQLPDPRVFEDRRGNVCVAVKDGYYVAGVSGLKPFHRAALPATVLAPLSVTAEQVEAGATSYGRDHLELPDEIVGALARGFHDGYRAALAAMGIPVVDSE